jgi:hypothetical protein
MKMTMAVEGTNNEIDDDLSVRYLIFSMKYPSIARKIKKEKLSVDGIDKCLCITSTEKTDINMLLTGIDDKMIRGVFSTF